MSDTLREIRNIIDDMKDMISENYVFSKDQQPVQRVQSEEVIPEESSNEEIPSSQAEIKNEPKNTANIDREIESIRKLSIKLLADLSPIDNPEECKLVKGIWNSCDSFLDKTKKPKNNNNI